MNLFKKKSPQHEQKEFEQNVREIAARLWPDSYGGAIVIDNQERDGIFETEDTIHLIEATVSRSKEKAVQDAKKLNSLIGKKQSASPEKAVKGWFITKDEPTGDQRSSVQKINRLITTCSFSQFKRKLIDTWEYISCRRNYPFGSVRDPKTGQHKFDDEYINVPLREEITGKDWPVYNIAEDLLLGAKFLIQGHYGSGKSMSALKIFEILIKKHQKDCNCPLPVFLNLRDHQGQTDTVEALHRHAKRIGFKNPHHLVRAWRAGNIVLILDGFDEMAVLGWAGKATKLKDIRYKSMELLRKFVNEQPTHGGFLITGRINYFDSINECINSLRFSGSTILRIGDFNHFQLQEYLRKKKLNFSLPEWMPTRPLLVSYLAAKGIITDDLNNSGSADIAEGWNYLMDKICDREADIEAGLEPSLIRQIIEGIANVARRNQSGLGPITQDDLERVFKEKCGYFPDDRALVLLQRLPNLTPQDQQDGTRSFIDINFAEAAKAGEVFRFIQNPYEYRLYPDPRKYVSLLTNTGIQVLSFFLKDLKDGAMEAAAIKANEDNFQILAGDILLAMNYLNYPWSREKIEIKDVIVPYFELKRELNWSRVGFCECIFQDLEIDEKPNPEFAPNFSNCLIGTVIGTTELKNQSDNIFKTCVVDNYEAHDLTTSSLLSIDQPVPVIVALTIFKKLYLQAGSGRQENAFYRGLSQNEQRYVSDILSILKQEGMAIPPRKTGPGAVWQPVRSFSERIRQIVLQKLYNDPLLAKIKSLA